MTTFQRMANYCGLPFLFGASSHSCEPGVSATLASFGTLLSAGPNGEAC
ncbi:MAG: hypothetical protein JWM03_1101 [Rhodocyclales bacterium]|nr:hypothetical protein [Rhodocyclales bacterium]